MKKKQLILNIIVIVIMTAMVALSELLGEKEIIFPEIAALAIGTLLVPKRSWNTTLFQMVLLIGICSMFGLCMVLFVPFSMPIKIVIAYAVCQALMMISRTTFAPMISAAILPILMGTESFIYPIAAVSFALLIAVIQLILQKAGVREKITYVPEAVPRRKDFANAAMRLFVVAVMGAIAIPMGATFAVAPPMIVAFTEFTKPNNKAKKTPIKTILVIFGCGLLGAFFRFVLCQRLGLPLTLAVCVTAIGIVLILTAVEMFLPPAGALAILPMIISESQLVWYPVQVLAGISIFMLIAIGYEFVGKYVIRRELATEE